MRNIFWGFSISTDPLLLLWKTSIFSQHLTTLHTNTPRKGDPKPSDKHSSPKSPPPGVFVSVRETPAMYLDRSRVTDRGGGGGILPSPFLC